MQHTYQRRKAVSEDACTPSQSEEASRLVLIKTSGATLLPLFIWGSVLLWLRPPGSSAVDAAVLRPHQSLCRCLEGRMGGARRALSLASSMVLVLATLFALCLGASVGFCSRGLVPAAAPCGGDGKQQQQRGWAERWAQAARRQVGRLQASAVQQVENHAAIRGAKVNRLISTGPVPIGQRDFLINGWRWHSLSVIRDLGRLKRVAEREQHHLLLLPPSAPLPPSSLPACFDFVWTFSGTALQKIEGELFYPWMRTSLPREAGTVLDHLDAIRTQINSLSQDLGVVCRGINGPSSPQRAREERQSRLKKVVHLATEMEAKARDLMSQQEAVVVPLVAAYVRPSEQSRFNNKVIARLGLLDSRLHLVCMAEAVRGNTVEEAKFRAQIPGVAQMMIPRWRTKLYQPKAACLAAA